MNTSRSPAYDCIRTRSPSSAPPVIGDDGSTATTATARPASADLADQGRDERRLARARRPGDPDEVGAAGERVQLAQRRLGDRRPVLDRGQEPGQGSPIAGRAASTSSWARSAGAGASRIRPR